MKRPLVLSSLSALRALAAPLQAQTPASPATLLQNVRIFDGRARR